MVVETDDFCMEETFSEDVKGRVSRVFKASVFVHGEAGHRTPAGNVSFGELLSSGARVVFEEEMWD
jgi:hypothetical protein